MLRCGGCDASLEETSRFCSSCGARVLVSPEDPTETRPSSVLPTAWLEPDDRTPPTARDPDRFGVGEVLAGRYRIVGLLGRGGMGEVYRADDLKLGLPVALKFLPESTERDPDALERFLDEARMALRVTHRNVTRVHDIVEIDGHHVLSMEFVDGEDLASLLRRIGRLPQDKAVEVARQICAGLSAAHGEGVLHRDLKPSNVMLDGRGQVKITDFGLAGLDRGVEGKEARAGTPAYMAPEQWEGGRVTARTDLYALGLVLYEVFTGRALYRGRTPGEIVRLQQESDPATPSSVVEGLDPAVERAIRRCLERRPEDRPPSAIAVSAGLPGGDPLAAVLAAGQTPSPELVKRSGGIEGIRPRWAVLSAVVVAAGLVASIGSTPRRHLVGHVPEIKPPEVLEDRARELLGEVGIEAAPEDRLWTFEPDSGTLSELAAGRLGDRGADPRLLLFRYRRSPLPLARINAGAIGDWMADPPSGVPGMARIDLDPRGRLVGLEIVPVAGLGAGGTGDEPDWEVLFRAAGFDPQDLEPTPAQRTPPFHSDVHRAWTAVWPGSGRVAAEPVEIRIEAAGLGGRAIWFEIFEPWELGDGRDPVVDPGPVLGIWFVFIVSGTGFLAWRNLRLGRGDRRGAFRTAILVGAVRLAWLLSAHHLGSQAEIDLLQGHLAWSAYRVCLFWIFYMALEPYARRVWPRMLTSWLRLLEGRFRDPLVGRDVLFGMAAGGVALCVRAVLSVETGLTGTFDRSSGPWTFLFLRGGRHMAGAFAFSLGEGLWGMFMILMALLLLRLLLRRTWAALVALAGIVGSIPILLGAPPLSAVEIVVVVGLSCLVVLRIGLLAAIVLSALTEVASRIPLTSDPSDWFADATWLLIALVAAVTAWSFRTALGGRSLFADGSDRAAASAAT